jgi:RNA polymerase sigma factor (TIGR02999 family)
MAEVTEILSRLAVGNRASAEELLPLVYDELRRLAVQMLQRETPGQTLQATALVHEAYLRLLGANDNAWDSRAHFFFAAAEAMRRILIDVARRKRRIRHGGLRRRIDFDEARLAGEPPVEDLLALDEALKKLAQIDPLKAQLVNLRYFAGLTIPHAAALLEISPATAGRYWAYARAWLHQEIKNA